MVAAKQLSLAALVWLGLANQGLALGIDQATNDLTVVERNLHRGGMRIALPQSHIAGIKHPRGDEELETREPKGFYGGHRSGGPRHGTRDIEELDERDAEEYDLEARSPMMPPRMGNFAGRRGGHRPRDIEARQFKGRGGFRAGGGRGGHRHNRRDVEELEERDVELEARQSRGRGGFRAGGGRGGHRHNRRDVEELEERDLELDTRQFKGRGGFRNGGHRHGRRDVEELDERDSDLETRQFKGRRGGFHNGGATARHRHNRRDIEEFDLEVRSPMMLPNIGSFAARRGGHRPRDVETRQVRGRPGFRNGGHQHGLRDVEELD